jgi:hypothetical protein
MILALVTLALAADPRPALPQVTQIDFDELDVTALRDGAPVTLITDRPKPHFPPMVKIRTSFDDRIPTEVNEVK